MLDAESLTGHLLPEGGIFAFLAAHRHTLFPDEVFGDLFADVVASVLVLQTLHNLYDRETVDALTFDLRWRTACGLAVTDRGFDPSILTYRRRRLARSRHPNRVSTRSPR